MAGSAGSRNSASAWAAMAARPWPSRSRRSAASSPSSASRRMDGSERSASRRMPRISARCASVKPCRERRASRRGGECHHQRDGGQGASSHAASPDGYSKLLVTAGISSPRSATTGSSSDSGSGGWIMRQLARWRRLVAEPPACACSRMHLFASDTQLAMHALRLGSMAKCCARHSAMQVWRLASHPVCAAARVGSAADQGEGGGSEKPQQGRGMAHQLWTDVGPPLLLQLHDDGRCRWGPTVSRAAASVPCLHSSTACSAYCRSPKR